jgi:hypothetical protein
MNRIVHLAATTAALLFALAPVHSFAFQNDAATAHPNFSGRWRMVKERSDFARAVMPDMVIRVIEQRDITMNIHTIQTTGTTTKTADVSYFIDGSPSTNIINNHEATSKTFWDGRALEVRTTLKLSNGDEELIEDRWELSDDGNTLTTTSHINTPKGGTVMKLVCEKETS